MELVDFDKFNSLINAAPGEEVAPDPNQSTSRMTMSIAEKTSFFIINAVLMSVCHCMQKAETEFQMKKGAINFLQNAFNIKDQDKKHILDMAKFYEENKDLCVSDVTNKKKVTVKIQEYGSENLR